jgi:hypothetical protein
MTVTDARALSAMLLVRRWPSYFNARALSARENSGLEKHIINSCLAYLTK